MNAVFEFGNNKVALVEASGRNQRTTMRAEARRPLRVPRFPPPKPPRGSGIGMARSVRVSSRYKKDDF